MWLTQFDKSLADTMVKQVKNKTTLKVRNIIYWLWATDNQFLTFITSLHYL